MPRVVWKLGNNMTKKTVKKKGINMIQMELTDFELKCIFKLREMTRDYLDITRAAEREGRLSL